MMQIHFILEGLDFPRVALFSFSSLICKSIKTAQVKTYYQMIDRLLVILKLVHSCYHNHDVYLYHTFHLTQPFYFTLAYYRHSKIVPGGTSINISQTIINT